MPPHRRHSTEDIIRSLPILRGSHVSLEPLEERHLQDLYSFASEDLFKYMNLWWRADSFESFAAGIDLLKTKLGAQAFAMVLSETGKAVGSSSYLDVRPEHRSLEIGATWIAREYQGTRVNPEAKLLMLTHAFEELGCIRVQFKTDGRNLQSQRAMEKIGCVREGVLRKHVIMRDGYVRDSVFYSILDSEWPEVRERLITRIG